MKHLLELSQLVTEIGIALHDFKYYLDPAYLVSHVYLALCQATFLSGHKINTVQNLITDIVFTPVYAL